MPSVAYNRNVDEPRESPIFKLRDDLLKKGALLSIFDSWVTSENTAQSLDECLEQARAVVIVTEHSDIIDKLNKFDLSSSGIKVIVDGNSIKKQNVLYRGIGR